MNKLIERLVQDLQKADEALRAADSMNVDPYRDPARLVGVHWILSARPAIRGDLARLQQLLAMHKDLQDVLDPNDLSGTAQVVQARSAAIEETLTAADQGQFVLVGSGQSFSQLLSEVLDNIHTDCQGIYDSYISMKS